MSFPSQPATASQPSPPCPDPQRPSPERATLNSPPETSNSNPATRNPKPVTRSPGLRLAGLGLLGWLRLVARGLLLSGLLATLALGLLGGWLLARWDHADAAAEDAARDLLLATAAVFPRATSPLPAAAQPQATVGGDAAQSPATDATESDGLSVGSPEEALADETAEAPEAGLAGDAALVPVAEVESADGGAAPADSPELLASALDLTLREREVSDPRDLGLLLKLPELSPEPSPGPVERPRPTPRVPSGPVLVHVVQGGETLSQIALLYRVDRDAIAEANELADEGLIVPGQRLLVPGGRRPAPTSTPTPVPARPTPRPTSAVVASQPTSPPRVAATTLVPRATPIPAAAPSTVAPAAAAPTNPPRSAPAAAARGLPVGPLGWPVSGAISQRFGENGHPGVDIAAPAGAAVRAAAAGTVIVAAKLSYGYGWRVILDHGSGVTTLYAHLSSFTVKEGDRVGKGRAIGAVGSTGLSTGPHLHFEVAVGGKTVDPLAYLP